MGGGSGQAATKRSARSPATSSAGGSCPVGLTTPAAPRFSAAHPAAARSRASPAPASPRTVSNGLCAVGAPAHARLSADELASRRPTIDAAHAPQPVNDPPRLAMHHRIQPTQGHVCGRADEHTDPRIDRDSHRAAAPAATHTVVDARSTELDCRRFEAAHRFARTLARSTISAASFST